MPSPFRPDPRDLAPSVPAWLRAARDDAIARDLEAIYTHVARAITQRGPACWASGRCCNFDRAGHLLLVTGLEAAYCLTRATPTTNANPTTSSPAPTRTLTLPQAPTTPAPTARPDCPFLHHNLCTVHTTKPLGCRVYFCDRSAQQWQHDLSEQGLLAIRDLHQRHQIPYLYAEWRALLEACTLHHVPSPP